MATNIAAYITQKMVDASVIKECDKSLYQYGFYLIVSRILFFLVSGAVGFLLKVFAESIIFYFGFSILRTYAGGIHAKTEGQCTVLTTIALSLSILGINVMEQAQSILVPTVMLIFGGLSIALFSPLDTQEKPLDEAERNHYRAICLILLTLYIASIMISKCLLMGMVYYSIITSIFLEGILLCIGAFVGHRCSTQNSV